MQDFRAQRLAEMLAASGWIPEEALEDGADAIARKIKRVFDQKARKEWVSPNYAVGQLLKAFRETSEITQEELRVGINAQLQEIGALEIGPRSQTNISRYENGIYQVPFLTAIASCRHLGIDYAALSPWPADRLLTDRRLAEVSERVYLKESAQGSALGVFHRG